MLDEKHLIENFTGVPGLYDTINLLKGSMNITIENGIESKGSSKSIWYKNSNNKETKMEINHDPRDMNTVIYYSQNDKIKITIYIRRGKEIEVEFFDGQKHGAIFVADNKIFYYDHESIKTACILSGGISSISSVEGYSRVSVYPDDIQEISQAPASLGESILFATSYAKDILLPNSKKNKR